MANHGPHGAGQKTNDELRGFAKKLCCLSEKLCVAVKEAEDSADPAFKQDLEKTRIASEEQFSISSSGTGSSSPKRHRVPPKP